MSDRNKRKKNSPGAGRVQQPRGIKAQALRAFRDELARLVVAPVVAKDLPGATPEAVAASSLLLLDRNIGSWTGTLRWGQLRDSDPFVGSTTKRPQPNYGVSFQMSVP